MKRVFAIILGIWILLSCNIHAQETQPIKPKSESTAFLYSFFGTLAPMGIGGVMIDGKATDPKNTVGAMIFSFGVLVGPGLGHLYTDNKRFGNGLLVRGATFAVMVYCVKNRNLLSDVDHRTGAFLLGTGACIIIYSMLLDIKYADESAREFNARHKLSQVEFQPYFGGNPNGFGLAFTFRY